MLDIIKRFFKATGSLRWKIYFAMDYENYFKKLHNNKFFVTGKLEAGEFATLNTSGDISKFYN